MSNIDPRKPSWAPKEPRRPQEASDTSEEEDQVYFRRAAPYEVRLRLGPITYGQDVPYYQDNQASLTELTYLQRSQLATDPSMYRKDKKGRVIKSNEAEKLERCLQKKKQRFQKKKQEKLLKKQEELQKTKKFQEDMQVEEPQMEGLGLPKHFGRFEQEKTLPEEEIHSALQRPLASHEHQNSESNSDGTHESDYLDEPFIAMEELPLTHEIPLESHTKAVCCIDIDPSTSRMATSSLDYTVKLWDFTSMNEALQYFRSFEPFEGHPVRDAKFSLNGKHLLVCAGDVQAKIFSKEGRLHYECVKGDMYIADMTHTKGHTQMVTCAEWHPQKQTYFGTSSLDGTVRVWDLQGKLIGMDKQLSHTTLHKARNSRNLKVGVDTLSWSPFGNLIFGGCSDGSIQVWETQKGNSPYPKLTNYQAHHPEITCIKHFEDGNRFLSRAQDDTLKLWDLRRFNTPIHSWENLPCRNYRFQVELSPSEDIILCGTSSYEKKGPGFLKIFKTETFEELGKLQVESGVVAVKWQSALNQVILGCSNGKVINMYNPKQSQGGLVECIKRPAQQYRPQELFLDKPIITPYSLPQFKQNFTLKSKELEKQREDPFLTQKPKEPIFPPSSDGRMLGINTLTQYIINSSQKAARPEDDPREALLSYHKETTQKPVWVAPAYSQTQPQPLFDYSKETYQEREYLSKNLAPKCKSCGLKFCTCSKRRTGDDPVFSIEK